MGSWPGYWPVIHKVLQNTVAYIGLIYLNTGRKHGVIILKATPGGARGYITTLRFVCTDDPIWNIVSFEDNLTIEEQYASTIAPRYLDTNISNI